VPANPVERPANCPFPNEDNDMHRFLISSALVLGTALIGPVVAPAQDASPSEKRYYDQKGHDYYAWNNGEDRAYRALSPAATSGLSRFQQSEAGPPTAILLAPLNARIRFSKLRIR